MLAGVWLLLSAYNIFELDILTNTFQFQKLVVYRFSQNGLITNATLVSGLIKWAAPQGTSTVLFTRLVKKNLPIPS